LLAYATLSVPPPRKVFRSLRRRSTDASAELDRELETSYYSDGYGGRTSREAGDEKDRDSHLEFEARQAALFALKDAVEDIAQRSEAQSVQNTIRLQALHQNLRTLNDEVRRLSRALKESLEAREQERTRARWFAFLTFWGGIALSIPIGVVINLSTK
jgi:hypothetical protein